MITRLVELYEHDLAGRDMQGDLYAYMLSKIQTAGVNGQFRTPKHIREMTVGLVKPTPGDQICDPACGTTGFLISSAEYLREHYEADMTAEQWERFAGDAYTGFDTEPTMQRIAAMYLMLRAITKPTVERRDGVSKSNADAAQYDVVLATPRSKARWMRRTFGWRGNPASRRRQAWRVPLAADVVALSGGDRVKRWMC